MANSPGTWLFRGYLPHFDARQVVQHVTFHLADSLPRDTLARFAQELASVPPERHDVERRIRMDAWLDAGHGCCLLRGPQAARLVQESLLHFDGVRYRLFAWCVMPNHVHVLFGTLPGWSLPRIVASWKSYTGRRLSPLMLGNAALPAATRVWHREYWDRFIRDEKHFRAAQDYIDRNPVQADLVGRPEDWPWCSAAAATDWDRSFGGGGKAG